METIVEQIKQTIIKEITRETLEECIKEIDKEICMGKLSLSAVCKNTLIAQCYLDGLTMATNIIREMVTVRFGIILKAELNK